MNENGLIGWTPILSYREFFDIPRAFVIEPVSARFLLFDCPFEDKIDDYANAYSVYALQIASIQALPQDWRSLISNESLVGKVAVADIEFDTTRRRQIRMQSLAELILAAEHSLVPSSTLS